MASNPLLHRSIAGSRVSAKAAGVDDVTDDKDTGDDISTTARSKVLGKRKVYADPHPRQHPSESDMRILSRRYFQQDGLYDSVFAMVLSFFTFCWLFLLYLEMMQSCKLTYFCCFYFY